MQFLNFIKMFLTNLLSLRTGFIKFENRLSIPGAITKTGAGAQISPHPVRT